MVVEEEASLKIHLKEEVGEVEVNLQKIGLVKEGGQVRLGLTKALPYFAKVVFSHLQILTSFLSPIAFGMELYLNS